MKSQATKLRPQSEGQSLAQKIHCLKAFVVSIASQLQPHKIAIFKGGAALSAVLLVVLTTKLVPESTNSSSTTTLPIEIGLQQATESGAAAEGAVYTTGEALTDIETLIETESSASQNAIPLVVNIEPEIAIPDPAEALHKQVTTVRSGDSLSLIFDRSGFSPRQLYEVVSESEHGDELGRLFPGKEITFYSKDSGELVQMKYQVSALQSYVVDKTEAGYKSQFIERQPESFTVVKTGEIETSFYIAGLGSGLSDNLIMQLAGIFGWDIDFALEIRSGDTFSVVHEDRYLDGEAIGEGNILAAEFVNQGRTYRAIRHTDSSGRSAYYTPEGESMRKAFLRTPVDIFWISSHFNPTRRHPVLDTTRPHNGTDYAANTGTPVKATGDGRVTSARYSSSYGNVVEIQHGQNYKTLYAHLNGFARGIRTGSEVQQGDIIGYVGMTGLATGPHLHFEFYQNGVVRNPVTVDLPNGAPLSDSEMPIFRQAAIDLIKLLDNPAVQYAEDSSRIPNQI